MGKVDLGVTPDCALNLPELIKSKLAQAVQQIRATSTLE